jgi:hypothetical protein
VSITSHMSAERCTGINATAAASSSTTSYGVTSK